MTTPKKPPKPTHHCHVCKRDRSKGYFAHVPTPERPYHCKDCGDRQPQAQTCTQCGIVGAKFILFGRSHAGEYFAECKACKRDNVTTRQRIALETKAAIKATRAAAKTEKTAKQLRKAEMQRAWRMKTVEVETPYVSGWPWVYNNLHERSSHVQGR